MVLTSWPTEANDGHEIHINSFSRSSQFFSEGMLTHFAYQLEYELSTLSLNLSIFTAYRMQIASKIFLFDNAEMCCIKLQLLKQ